MYILCAFTPGNKNCGDSCHLVFVIQIIVNDFFASIFKTYACHEIIVPKALALPQLFSSTLVFDFSISEANACWVLQSFL